MTFFKTLALILFFVLPIMAFIMGANYQKKITTEQNLKPVTNACTEEAKICPDGSSVGRVGPSCEFAACPETSTPPSQGSCGGIAGELCPDGYECQLSGNYPDASGICVKKTPTTSTKYTCPSSDYVDCMPGPDKAKSECSLAYLQWAQQNCPNFKGAAY